MNAPTTELNPSTDLPAVRQAIRQGRWTSHTSGVAQDRVQGNVVILPQQEANDFLRFCQRNPKPCPLLAVSEPGEAMLPTLGDRHRHSHRCADATASGATASWWRSAPTSRRCGATIW